EARSVSSPRLDEMDLHRVALSAAVAEQEIDPGMLLGAALLAPLEEVGDEDIPVARLAGGPPDGAKLLAGSSATFLAETGLEGLQRCPGSPRRHAQPVNVLDVAVRIMDRQGQRDTDHLKAHFQDAPRRLGGLHLRPQPIDPLAVCHDSLILRPWSFVIISV